MTISVRVVAIGGHEQTIEVPSPVVQETTVLPFTMPAMVKAATGQSVTVLPFLLPATVVKKA